MTNKEAIDVVKGNFGALANGIEMCKQCEATDEKECRDCVDEAFEMAIEALKQPEVIRCKDCKNNKGDYFCEEVMKLIHDDDYCAWAERRR